MKPPQPFRECADARATTTKEAGIMCGDVPIPYYRPKEVARVFRIGVTTTYKLKKEGALEAVKLNGMTLFTSASVLGLMRRLRGIDAGDQPGRCCPFCGQKFPDE
jgi:hypothetical protein